MMLRSVFAALALLMSVGLAQATCPSPLVVKDGNSNPQNFSTSSDAAGNCEYNMVAGPYQFQSAGAGQYGVSLNSITSLTVPTGTLQAEICVESATARYTTSGTSPSSTVGVPVVPPTSSNPQCFPLSGFAILSTFQIIGAGATMDVEYFK